MRKPTNDDPIVKGDLYGHNNADEPANIIVDLLIWSFVAVLLVLLAQVKGWIP